MSSPISGTSQSKSISGLGTYVHTALTSTLYKVSISLSMVPPSGLTVTISQNATTIASASVSSALQQTLALNASIEATMGDALNVVLTSSSSNDTVPNHVKGVLTVSQGPE